MNAASDPRHAALSELARTYTPEWRFSPENPDPGSAVALLVDDMLAQGEKRLQTAMHKYRIQYLNLFDRLAVEPVESARSYVRFEQVSGADRPVHVPKGTELVAEDSISGNRLIFETAYSITTTPARLTGVYATDLSTDRIVCLAEDGGAPEAPFYAFGLDPENQAEHKLILCFDTALDALDGLSFGLLPKAQSPEELEAALLALTAPNIRYSMLEPEGKEYPFDRVYREEGVIRLEAPAYLPQKVEQNGRLCYALCVRAQGLPQIELTSAGLIFAGEEIPPDEVAVNGVAQQAGRFLPFGRPMEIYSECALECRQVFARRGAKVEMRFDLEFQVVEQTLPETMQEEDFKVIMKRPSQAAAAEAAQVKADYVLLEYRSRERGWRRLLLDEHTAALFNGSAQGELCVSFVMPGDMAAEDGEPRLRLRLIRADGLYSVPNIQSCPVISGLRFSYRYDERGLLPDYACTLNNFETVDVTERIEKQREFPLFYSREHPATCMYLGFDENPQGMPLSLYFDLENDEDAPLEYAVEYLRGDSFTRMQPTDNTRGLLYSGTLLLPVPGDCTAAERFGRRAYWLRLVLRRPPAGKLPIIHRVETNMALVENRRTATECFYMEDEDAPLILSLAEQNLVSAAVYVNEEDDDPLQEDHWVRWSRRTGREQRGRCCDIDLATGTVSFFKNAFAPYPLKEGRPAVKVEYQSFQGSAANVPAGRINTLTQSLRHISSASNPIPAFGGYDSFSEESWASAVSKALRTRGRAVTARDYQDLISQVSHSVRRMKCVARGSGSVAIALLIDEYEKGSHIFSAIRDDIREKLIESSILAPMGKELTLLQPHFLRFSVRIWLDCLPGEDPYELQQNIRQDICAFIDPLKGGFEGEGWEIGQLPTVRRLLAWLKRKRPGTLVSRVVMSADYHGREYAVDDDIEQAVDDPFAMAINGDHAVYVDLSGQ